MVLMTHNTDIADSWEREGEDPSVLLCLLAERLRGRHERGRLCDDALTCFAAAPGRRRAAGGDCRGRRAGIAACGAAAGAAASRRAFPTADSFDGALQLLPPDVLQRMARGRRLRMEHRLSGTPTSTSRCASASSPRCASAGSRRRRQSPRRAADGPVPVPVPVPARLGRRHRGLRRRRGAALRTYFEKGGFLWVDDFWGERAWQVWVSQISKVLPPAEYPIVDVPPEHPLWRALFEVKSCRRSRRSASGAAAAAAPASAGSRAPSRDIKAINDRHGRIMS